MQKELKEKWIAALRSGKYRKGKLNLYDKYHDCYCALGVLCIAAGHKFTEEFEILENGSVGYVEISKLLEHEEMRAIWNQNDSQNKSFEEIANYIEQNL